MRVYPERMRRNLDSTRGLIFSGQLLLDLATAGMLREEAYRVVQGLAMRAWESEGEFRSAVKTDANILSFLSVEETKRRFRWTGNWPTSTASSRGCFKNRNACNGLEGTKNVGWKSCG